jgi:hypothetical protein
MFGIPLRDHQIIPCNALLLIDILLQFAEAILQLNDLL